jgi:hypothetical protein
MKSLKKISDKLNKVSDSFTINRYDNGFMIEVGGKDSDNEWANAKIICTSEEELLALVKEAINMEMDS